MSQHLGLLKSDSRKLRRQPLGISGVLVGLVVFLLIANSISSASQPLEFLPQPWGAAGQWFPPGAGATLLRNLSYFPNAPVMFPWLVLTIWAAVGITLALIGHFRSRVTINVESTTLQAAGAANEA